MPLRRLLTVGHSYCVSINRRLAHELARAGGDAWDVTVAGPAFFRGDLRPVVLEPQPGEPCRVEALPARFTGRIHVMLYGRRLRQLLHERWDVVHAWEEPYILAGGQIAWHKPASARLVFATFQNIAKRYLPPFSWVERYAMRRAAGWVAFGKLVEETLKDRSEYADRPHRVIPAGVDLMCFRPDPAARVAIRKALGWFDSTPVVGYLGRFVPEKGLSFLMRVLERLPAQWNALFVGGGPMLDALQSWSRRRPDRVRVVTGVMHDQVPAYLNAMDVICAPSQTTHRWREQLGRMLIEAMACGVPVVGSNSGEIPHVVSDCGVIVGENDEEDWINALARLLDNPSARVDLARRGRERAAAVFSWPVIARQHLDFFTELLNQALPDDSAAPVPTETR